MISKETNINIYIVSHIREKLNKKLCNYRIIIDRLKNEKISINIDIYRTETHNKQIQHNAEEKISSETLDKYFIFKSKS